MSAPDQAGGERIVGPLTIWHISLLSMRSGLVRHKHHFLYICKTVPVTFCRWCLQCALRLEFVIYACALPESLVSRLSAGSLCSLCGTQYYGMWRWRSQRANFTSFQKETIKSTLIAPYQPLSNGQADPLWRCVCWFLTDHHKVMWEVLSSFGLKIS